MVCAIGVIEALGVEPLIGDVAAYVSRVAEEIP
jgi:hypothetical protein